MIWNILLFEIRRRMTRPVTYFNFLLFALLGFMGITRASIGRGLMSNMTLAGRGNIEADAPYALYYYITMISTFGMLIAMAWFADSASRDFKHKAFHLFYSYPLGKLSYLGGRFGGPLVGIMFVLSGIAFGGLVATVAPWTDQTGFGQLNVIGFFHPYLFSVLPNMFLAGALFFSITLLSRQFSSVWAGMIAIVVLHLVGMALVRTGAEQLAGLLDPSGLVASRLTFQYWSIAQKNELMMPLTGILLLNRLLWMSVATGICIFTWRRFNFVVPEVGESGKELSKESGLSESKFRPTGMVSALQTAKSFSLGSFGSCLIHLLWDDFLFLARRKSFYFVVALGLGLVLTVAFNNVGFVRGTQTFPVTSQVLTALCDSLYFLGVLVALYCSSALVWRERETHVHEIFAVLPVPGWVPLFSKIIAMSLIQVIMMLLVMVGGMVLQINKGYYHFEFDLYLTELLGVQLVFYVLVSVFSLFTQVLTGNKLLGFLVTFFFIDDFMEMFGLKHHLWTFASRPVHEFSDMNGYGPFLSSIMAYNTYWIFAAVILVVFSLLLYPRGLDTSLKQRLIAMGVRFSRPNRIALITGLSGCLVMGGFIVYNTVFLNEFKTKGSLEKQAANYEKDFKYWDNKPMPHLAGIEAKVNLFPTERRVESSGVIRLKNETGSPIDTLFIQVPQDAIVLDLNLDTTATLVRSNSEHGVYLFKMSNPIQPGGSAALNFDFELHERGFVDRNANTRLVKNGSFLTVVHLFPASGYNSYDLYELGDNDKRKKHGLEPKARLSPVSNDEQRMRTLLGDHADWIDFDVVVSTDSDQTALAPGALLKEWAQDGRRYFHYRAKEKILCYAAVLSGKFEVRRDSWDGIDIEVYYHPDHANNIDLMIESVQLSLEYFTREFSPYQFPAVRIVEFPRYEIFAEAFPGLIPLSEGYGFIAKYDEQKIKEVFRVIAHEIGHQWWAHQVIGGNVEGTYVLSEVMSQYSALVISRKEYDQSRLDAYVRNETDRYLKGRSREIEEEVPLVRTNQNTWYEHYAKGFVVMNSLLEYIGEEKLNQGIREFIAANAFQEPPFAIAPDLVNHFKAAAPDSLVYLVEDCFDRIVLFDNQAVAADYVGTPDGKYEVTLTYQARKWHADGQGNETRVPLKDLVEFAVFDDQNQELARCRQWVEINITSAGDSEAGDKVDDPTEKITMVVDRIPARAGIDPHSLFIDKEAENNLVDVVSR